MFDTHRHPVDRQAAIVTSQSGCASDDTLTDAQKRENLVVKWKALQERIVSLPKNSRERKRLGQEFQALGLAIRAIRPKRNHPGVNDYIVDVIKEELTVLEFQRLLDKAVAKKEAAEAAEK